MTQVKRFAAGSTSQSAGKLAPHGGRWQRRRVESVGLALAAMLLAFGVAARAQEEQAPPGEVSHLKTIPLEDTPEFRELREGRATNPYTEVTRRSLAPAAAPEENRFLIAIDISKLDSAVVGGSQEAQRSLSVSAAGSLEDRTTYDAKGSDATSFETRYEELNTTLQCHWAYDDSISKQLGELDAKAREAELEKSFEQERKGAAPQPEEERAAQPEQSDPEFDFTLKERQFKYAGRPCLLTVTCQDDNDPRCSEQFIDQAVKSVVPVREGAR